jgi:HK97 family phage prohead protease
MPEYKSGPQFVKEISDRTVTGIFAVHGNVDDGDWYTRDRSHPGSFADTAIKGRDRARFLWQHNGQEPPTAVIKSIRELAQHELPPAVLSFAPEATGAVEVVREYLETQRASEILEGLRKGAIEEMSYGYDIAEWKMTEDPDNDRPIREILKVRLWDISDVNWGMNPATVGSKGVPLGLPLSLEHEAVLAAAQRYTDRLKTLRELRAKEGRVLSGDNRKRVQEAVEAMESAKSALDALLAASEPKTDDDEKRQQRRLLWLQGQQTLAALNGVARR